MEAVEADQLTRPADRDVARLERGRPLRTRRRGVAGDERQAADAARQTVPAEDPPDAVGADPKAAPALLGEGRTDAPGPSPGWPRLKATMRCSMSGPSWLGMRGGRRSLGRSISRPERTTGPRQR